MAKLAENHVAVDAELADAVLRGTAAHVAQQHTGKKVTMVPWAAVVPLCCFPFTFEAPTGEPPFQLFQVYVSTFENTKARGPASVGLAGPGGGRPTWHVRARCVGPT